MRKVILSDVTLRESESSASHSLSFKEKIEIAKQMDKLHCDIIEMPKIKNTSTDVLNAAGRTSMGGAPSTVSWRPCSKSRTRRSVP